MRRRPALLLIALLTVVSIVGCAPPQLAPPTETPSPRPTTPTPTPATAEASEPPTAEPTESPPKPLPITFDGGETSATRTGRLDEGTVDRYTFRAQEGTSVVVSVTAAEPLSLTIVQGDYLRVTKPAARQTRWQGELPASGETLVDLHAAQATPYTLTLRLPPSPEPDLELVQPNGDEVWLEGTAHTILWRASGVDLVDIEAASGGKAWLLATGVDAASGEYVWEIPVGLVSNFGVASSDAMRVRVSSSGDPSLYDQNDQPFTVACPRIAFDPGATSAAVNGTLQRAGDEYRYVLEAQKDQAVELEVSPGVLEVAVWGAEDGSTWEIPSGSSRLAIAALPAAQEYFITLSNPSEGAVNYVVDVTIR